MFWASLCTNLAASRRTGASPTPHSSTPPPHSQTPSSQREPLDLPGTTEHAPAHRAFVLETRGRGSAQIALQGGGSGRVVGNWPPRARGTAGRGPTAPGRERRAEHVRRAAQGPTGRSHVRPRAGRGGRAGGGRGRPLPPNGRAPPGFVRRPPARPPRASPASQNGPLVRKWRRRPPALAPSLAPPEGGPASPGAPPTPPLPGPHPGAPPPTRPRRRRGPGARHRP